MNKLFLLFIIGIAISFPVPPNLQSVCPSGCKRYYNCDLVQAKCVYKGFWPLYPLELIEVLVLSISSALATACGIGGGTVYSAFLLGVQEFEPLEAFPISNCLILVCGLVTFFACVIDKYEHPSNKFVDYDMAIIFGPSMLLGAKFGTIFNKLFSSLFLTVAVQLVLIYSIVSTYKNVNKAKAKEAQYEKEQQLGEISINSTEPLIPRDKKFQSQMNSEKIMALTPSERAILKEDENPLRMDRILFILGLEIIVIVDQFLEGNAKLPSFIGITRCSLSYWGIFIGYMLISLLFLQIAYAMVKSHIEKRKQIDPSFKDEKMSNVSDHILKVILVAILAGIVSSMVGIGGGMITNPMFASLGLDPKESSSTSNFLIITTATATTFLFSFAGQLNYSFALWLLIPCSISAFIGSFFILAYINKTKRSSILLVIMLYFLIASMLIIMVKGYYDFTSQPIMNLFAINNYC